MFKNQELKYFEEIFKLYHPVLCKHVSRIIHDLDAAEDIVQDVFIGFWDKNQERKIDNPYGYLYKACINRALNYVSINNRRTEINDMFLHHSVPSERISLEQSLEFRELELRVQSAIEALPPMCRKVFLLSRYEEMSHKEIASFLHISPNTVDNHIKKALSILRKILLHLSILLNTIHIFY